MFVTCLPISTNLRAIIALAELLVMTCYERRLFDGYEEGFLKPVEIVKKFQGILFN